MAKKKKIVVAPPVVETINEQTLEELMGERYAAYAKYVIQDRAIPDARDGLKPVQRRIIYAMYHSGNLHRKPYRKCASSVGEVMGKYHPHGDSSIYEALAHMSQQWKYRVPLIDFQGNNGSIDGDNPAAHRYTEARLAEISEELTRDIEKETVDMQLTFDDSQLEPIVLPARFPNLYANGTTGIAVALATNIPPHNLGELIEATIYRLTHPKCRVEDLLEFVKGPDFPTGASIVADQGLKDIYEFGRGRVEIISKMEVIHSDDMSQIIVTEIPYGVIKSKLVRDIDEIRYKKVIDGILEVRDESDHRGLRIAIDLRKDANAEIIETYLMNRTELKSAFNANMVAIVNGHPQTLTLIDYLDAFIAHQVDVVTRLSQFDLTKANARKHIVEGLIKAISILDEVVTTIRKSSDKANAIENLVNLFGFSKLQADAIVNLQLYRLTNTDVTILIDERATLNAQIEQLEAILGDPKKLDKTIISDLKAMANKYGTPRQTIVIEEPFPTRVIDKRDLISKEDVIIAITRDGYVKRSSIKSYKSSDTAIPGMKECDVLLGVTYANTLDYLLAFTNLGNYIFLPVHEMFDNKWKDEGRHINYICTLNPDEKILKAFLIKSFKEDVHIGFVTRNGQIKRTKLSEFLALRYSRPLGCFRLLRDDEVVDVAILTGNSDLLVITEKGNATLFNENELTPVGIKAGGIKAIASLKGGDHVAALLAYEQGEKGKILMVTDAGHWRIFDYNYVAVTNRLGKVQYVYKTFKSEPHALIYVRKLSKKEEQISVKLLLDDKTVLDYSTADFHPTPSDKYAKRNLPLPRNSNIQGVYNDTLESVTESTKTYQVAGETQSAADANGKYEQISIFDDMGD
ncbi:MAG TPA: DNA topoisomerase IV subunit A [Firmicutes bacterium]|nr:DNA topoisomerase IV subunit A [Bacillota bacterium]